MVQKTYSEKLLDPRWQKKRLHIFNRDGFACSLCGDKETTLHVHHMTYKKGKEPWEYEDDNFKTVCKNCHILYGDWQENPEYSLIKYCLLEEFGDWRKYALLLSKFEDNEEDKIIYLYRIDHSKNDFHIYGMLSMSDLSRLFDLVNSIK